MRNPYKSMLRAMLASTAFCSIPSATASQVSGNGVNLPLPYRVITQFAEPTWIENIAVRANGELLLSFLLPNASLWSVARPADTTAGPQIDNLGLFQPAQGLMGIAEPEPDLFVLASSVFTSTTDNATTVCRTWTADFRGGRTAPEIKVVADIPNATIPNGVTAVPGNNSVVLIADSGNGLVYRVDISTGRHDVAVQVPEMAVVVNAQVGVNGIHVHDGHLYWTNAGAATIYRLRINTDGSPATKCGAKVETVAKLDATFLDDFAISADGTIWVVTDFDNRLIAVQPTTGNNSSTSVVVEGAVSELTLAGGTSAAFGRGETDRHVLYVTTNGGLNSPVNGTVTEGGKVVAVDTSGFRF
ncbi:Uu.00g042970.m01.CDS01 [Anthostomella pinea]|uniref:Uu.00g042970.m01.CDS01 n=1 Tax=Anthostomella pinea TaxID=933095 RepID=A0AAI8VAK5_9PEZI|nr:Uu.00g042970.m01.CDS01 [Anthostomella pinea]